jgi:hypothetical protein
MEKMSLTIMSHSWEVKPFFATAKVSGERKKYTDLRPFPILATIKKGTSSRIDIQGKCFLSDLMKARLHVESQNLSAICCKDRNYRCRCDPPEPTDCAIFTTYASLFK